MYRHVLCTEGYVSYFYKVLMTKSGADSGTHSGADAVRITEKARSQAKQQHIVEPFGSFLGPFWVSFGAVEGNESEPSSPQGEYVF